MKKTESFQRLQAQLGLSSRALAERLGVHETTIYRWRKGKPPPPESTMRLMELAAGLSDTNIDPWPKQKD